MAPRSAGGRSESEANADTSEGMCRLGIEVLELRDVLLVLPRLQANLAYELHGREGEATVDECQGARVGRVDHHARPGIRQRDRKSTHLNSRHSQNSHAVFCFEKKKNTRTEPNENQKS